MITTEKIKKKTSKTEWTPLIVKKLQQKTQHTYSCLNTFNTLPTLFKKISQLHVYNTRTARKNV